MSNHVHLIVVSQVQVVQNVPIVRTGQDTQRWISAAIEIHAGAATILHYTQYFNLKHHKVGHRFQGRYKAIVCEKDEYLLTLVRYIHLNPTRAKIAKLDEYPFSGHREYAGDRVRDGLSRGGHSRCWEGAQDTGDLSKRARRTGIGRTSTI
jgi:REP element-mobilizing transposase RayT